MILKRAFKELDMTADEARRIDIHQRGARLSVDRIPVEVVPLVAAVNDAGAARSGLRPP